MKRKLVILGNLLIVAAVIAFVVLYTGNERQRNLAARTDAFSNMTAAMENITTNYLEGEQRICNSWAHYINAGGMTAEEAAAFVRESIADTPDVMGHILFLEGQELTGFSTAPRAGKTDDYTVSYSRISIFSNGFDEFLQGDGSVKVTRAYTNPINAIRSIAFCCPITLRNAQTGELQSAVLLRIVPVSTIEQKWVFPTDTYKSAEIALISTDGDYIIKGRSFKNSNFFEFYQSYNESSASTQSGLAARVAGPQGTMEMNDSTGKPCMMSHIRVHFADNMALITMIPMEELSDSRMDWTLAGVISAGLLLLLVMDIIVMMRFNRQLKAAADAADEASRAKTDFLSTMSHDIRTPMNAIIGLTTLTGKNVEDTAAVRENLHKINLASNHLLTLINDILDISKVESGKLTLNPATFSIVECAENLVNISQPMVREKNIDFNFRTSRMEHEYLYADQLRINQIFINLLSNAIKYTEPGGRVCVNLQEEPGSAEGTVRLVYEVADTGIGMTPEYMERMYQPFSRQTDSRVNTVQGTGLGLAITKQMIDLMKGTIDCVSEVGKGTTFTVRLDIRIADRPAEEMLLPPMRVLIADDDEVLLDTARETLESIGATVDTASSGARALEMIGERDDYRVIILDWKMPDMDGIETARRIRARGDRNVTILLISAYDWSDLEEKAREAGADGFISKPLFRSTLYDKLNEMLGNRTERTDKQDDYSDIAGMRILVAEDNDINWEIISALLEMYGIETERAENGQLAVDRIAGAEAGRFNMVFMDIQMPVMNGIEACRAIRALPEARKCAIPVVAMTADAFSENVAECMSAGMNGHIAKPIDMKLVLKEIRKVKEGEGK